MASNNGIGNSWASEASSKIASIKFSEKQSLISSNSDSLLQIVSESGYSSSFFEREGEFCWRFG